MGSQRFAPELDQARLNRMWAAYRNSDATVEAIARRFGIGRDKFHELRKQYNIPMRPVRGR